MSRDCEHGQLARSCNICDLERELKAVTAQRDKLMAALAEVIRISDRDHDAWNNDDSDEFRHAYRALLGAAPQPPKLSDERILELFHANNLGGIPSAVRFARAIEREILGGAQS